ncbi:MAG: STAS-like domain-containing protein [Bacteroidota bacterium]|nr:STAS-like domain-containing protein [Bacteroidota bacterium]
MILKVKDYTGNNLAVSAEDGRKLFNDISKYIDKGELLKLDFTEIELTISAFLNTAIGQLYAFYPQDKIKELLIVENMDTDDLLILKIVVDEAKTRFKNYPDIDTNDIDVVNES